MKRCGFLLLPPDTLRPDVGAENLGRSCAGRLRDEAIIYQRSAPSKIIGQQTHETENKVRLDLPRIIQRKENAPEFDYSSFYTKTGAGDPAVSWGKLAVPGIIAQASPLR
jgi:hypothetical protein